jgi:hypothetical protein
MSNLLNNPIPKVYQEFWDYWNSEPLRQSYLLAYQQGQQSFVPNLLPEQAVGLGGQETLDILRGCLGQTLDLALDPTCTDPDQPPAELPQAIQSPVANEPDGSWLKKTNMVGINVRTVDSFWNMIKYSLTLSQAQDSIHILPIWEAGVVGSIYGISSWELNPEFYSAELAGVCPTLDTTGKQLKAAINILHALGKTVGMDVIPHTDRYSQITLAYPEYFEWLRRQDTIIIDHAADLHEDVQQKIIQFLEVNGSAGPDEDVPDSREAFFSEDVAEDRRLRILFGLPGDPKGREARRNQLIRHLYRYGYEPTPGTMAPPFRGLEVDTRDEAKTVDEHGQVWRDYVMAQPEPMSRVFGPLGRYKLYERLADNSGWAIDFDKPRLVVWQYVCEKYYDVQRRYGFDFMRGDMSHVQMRPDGVPARLDRYYDILGAVKNYIRQDRGVGYFGYFAETFLPPRDVMSYGEEIDHLEAFDADTTLGDLQSTVVGSPEFLQRFRRYYDLLETRSCAPNFTVITADKDDPRFDAFYLKGNELRLFIALFLTDMPSYMGLGFEVRDVHHSAAPNEHYTKLFVFQERSGPKATHGPYIWGRNGFLYHHILRLKHYLDVIWPRIARRPVRWLLPPDATAGNSIIAWTQRDDPAAYVFVANTNVDHDSRYFALPLLPNISENTPLTFEFSTAGSIPATDQTLTGNGKHYRITNLAPGEGRVYRVG